MEAGYENGIRMVGKKIELQQPLEMARKCRELGIPTKFFFIIGFPWETETEINETIAYAEKLARHGADRIALNILKVYPGTPIARLYEIKYPKIYSRMFPNGDIPDYGQLNGEDPNNTLGKYNSVMRDVSPTPHLTLDELVKKAGECYRRFEEAKLD